MKKSFLFVLLLGLLSATSASRALDEMQAEDLADLTAIFVYLKNDCGYRELPNSQIKRAIVFFANRNGWDIRNYDPQQMKTLGEERYHDLRRIAIPLENKCRYLARDSLGLLTYAN